jgi:hypothetical protein
MRKPIKPITKTKRPRGHPKNDVPTKKVSRRVDPSIWEDINAYITLKNKQLKESRGEL